MEGRVPEGFLVVADRRRDQLNASLTIEILRAEAPEANASFARIEHAGNAVVVAVCDSLRDVALVLAVWPDDGDLSYDLPSDAVAQLCARRAEWLAERTRSRAVVERIEKAWLN